mmetsp:Transcript_81195/g.238581  ORF Transcript_81195/g.238581 Transcript_81195/m.238581 type:complete len:233 (-) Transcript_81195:235-933(-)
MLDRLSHREALADARCVGQNQAWPRVCLCLQECSNCLLRVDVNADGCHVHILVSHCHAAQVLLGCLLSRLCKFRHCSGRSGLRCLTTGVAVHLGVQHQDLDVLLAGDNMVEAAIPDIISPSVASDDPVAAAAKNVAELVQCLELRVVLVFLLQQRLQLLHHLMVDTPSSRQEKVMLILLAAKRILLEQLPKLLTHKHSCVIEGILHLIGEIVPPLLEGTAHAKAKLSIVLKQ